MILYFFFASFAPVRCFVTYISLSAPSWPPPSLAVYHSNLVKLPDLQSQQKTRSPWIRLSRPPFLLSLLLGEYYKWSGFEAGANLFWRMKLMKSPQKKQVPGMQRSSGVPSTRPEWSGQGAASSSPQGATVPWSTPQLEAPYRSPLSRAGNDIYNVCPTML